MTSHLAAVGGRGAGDSAVKLVGQKALVHAGVYHVPGQRSPRRKLPLSQLVKVEAMLGEGLEPGVEVEVLAPGVEDGSGPVGGQDDRAQPAVAAGEGRLQRALPDIVEGERYAAVAGGLADDLLPGEQLLARLLACLFLGFPLCFP